jgi:hypothetical protein
VDPDDYITISGYFGGHNWIQATSKQNSQLGLQALHGISLDAGSDTVRVVSPMICTSVRIGNWTMKAPDYVFEKGYKLPSLKDVEKHIADKKHLPDVPSAAEMKKDGVDLAQLNMTLLKKVEELTLYVIDQNKMMEKQNKKIEKLEREMHK